jgi:hypothetical protein
VCRLNIDYVQIANPWLVRHSSLWPRRYLKLKWLWLLRSFLS